MSNARQVDLLLSGIFGLDGAPLSGGRVYCYNAGSSTPKNVYNDVGLTVASENPVILDENGKAIKYALGSYKLVVKDANDSTLYTYDNLTYGFNPESVTADYSGSIYLASMGGDSSAMQGSTTLTTPISSLTEGMRFVFQSPFDCAANATIAIDNADAVDLYISDGSAAVTAGYLEEGQFYEIIYDGSVFRVFSATAHIGTDKIANGSITTDKIIDGAITSDKLDDGAVTETKIHNGAVTQFKIAGGSIMYNHLAEVTALLNLYQRYDAAGSYTHKRGKIFNHIDVSGESVTIDVTDSDTIECVPYWFTNRYSSCYVTINFKSGGSTVFTYHPTKYLAMVKNGIGSWSLLDGE